MKVYQNIKVGNMPSYLVPVIISGSVIHSCTDLGRRGFDKSFSQLIVPSFILFFGVPLCANLVYKQVTINHITLGSYFLGVALFFLTKEITFIKTISSIFPIIGRISMLCEMKNIKEPLTNITIWLIMNEFVGLTFQRVFFGDKAINFVDYDFTDLIGNILIVNTCRYLDLPDIFVILSVSFLVTTKRLKKMKKKKVAFKSSKGFTVPKVLRTPRRQAAIPRPVSKIK